jgi:hypothetical protein
MGRGENVAACRAVAAVGNGAGLMPVHGCGSAGRAGEMAAVR